MIVTDKAGNKAIIGDSVIGTFRYGQAGTYESNGTMFPDSYWQSGGNDGYVNTTNFIDYRDLVVYRQALCEFYSKAPLPGTHGGDGVFRVYIPRKDNGSTAAFTPNGSWYGPDPLRFRNGGTVFWGASSPESRILQPTSTCKYCEEIENYGLDLSNHTFTFRDEVEQYLSNPGIDRISAMDNYTMELLRDSKIRNNDDPTKIYNIVCTNYFIKDFECYIAEVSYDRVPEYNLFIAKYWLSSGINPNTNSPLVDAGTGGPNSGLTNIMSPDGYYYITTSGRLCYLTDQPIPNNGPNLPPVVLPPIPDVITPETPLIGSGSTYSPVIDQFVDCEFITKPLWPKDSHILLDKYCEVDGSQNDNIDVEQLSYGFDVYNKPIDDECKQKIFRVCYGDYDGLGMISASDGKTLTKAIYSQYAQKLLDDPLAKFTFNGVSADTVYIIDVERSLYKNWLDAGNCQWSFTPTNDSTTGYTTGAEFDNVNFEIDTLANCSIYIDTNVQDINPNEFKDYYDVRWGNLKTGVDELNINIQGRLYPKHGVLIFNAESFAVSTGDSTYPVRYDYNCFNAYRFYTSIVTKKMVDDHNLESVYPNIIPYTIGRYIDLQFINYIYVRLKHTYMNFSNNPTFVIDDNGSIIPSMIKNPTVYPTSIGLYNRNKELLAVGKFSKPLQKSLNEEAMITVKIIQ